MTTMTVPEVAAMMRVSRQTIYAWCKSGTIPHVRIGGCVRFVPSEIERLLTKNAQVEEPPIGPRPYRPTIVRV